MESSGVKSQVKSFFKKVSGIGYFVLEIGKVVTTATVMEYHLKNGMN